MGWGECNIAAATSKIALSFIRFFVLFTIATFMMLKIDSTPPEIWP